MDNLEVRTESLLGSDKVIVGNKFSDLVLETLGKIYIKSGNSLDLIDNIIGSITNTSQNNVKIVNDYSEMEDMTYPGDGYFIFNKFNETLYLTLDDRYILLLQNESQELSGYVRKSGDLMTGPLQINTIEAPLIVASSKLIKNLNAQYLNGRSSEDFAKSREKEMIYGNWTFTGQNVSENSWQFKDNVKFFKNIIATGNISSPEYASGFSGYGWSLDANTNTLTIDNLIVRKLFKVYEMVINQISATNGSLWVSNSVKCESVDTIKILFKEDLETLTAQDLIEIIEDDSYYLITTKNLSTLSVNTDINDFTGNNIGIVSETESLSSSTEINRVTKEFVNYKYIIYIKEYKALLESPNFSPQLLLDEQSLNNIQDQIILNNLNLIYIYKQNKVLTWDSSGLEPQETVSLSTFNKDFQFYTVINSQIIGIKPYYKYFALNKNTMQSAIDYRIQSEDLKTQVPTLYIINTEVDKTPTLKAGDFVRCQKYYNNEIKYYDAIVTAQIKSNSYIIQKAESIFDTYTEISYNDKGEIVSSQVKENTIAYNKTSTFFSITAGEVIDNKNENYTKVTEAASGDDIIQIGNISDTSRQNAIYITSTDDQSPYIDVISGLNRPDYSVLYYYPKYKFLKVGIKRKGDIFVKGEFDSYYYQKHMANIVELPSALGISNKNPIVYVELKEDKYYQIYINDGTNNEIPSDTSKGYFITSYPTIVSEIETEGEKVKTQASRITKVRLGKLDGIYNEIFKESQPYGYGLYGENVYLTGEFYLNNGKSIVEFTENKISFTVSKTEFESYKTEVTNSLQSTAEDLTAYVDESIKGVQDQLDGVIESWFYDPVPTLDNEPAVNWTTDEEKNKHLGDLYYDGNGYGYRFEYRDNEYRWAEIKDAAALEALEAAKNAQDTADGKRRVFVSQPQYQDAYDIGDLWVNATYGNYSNDLLRCKISKAKNTDFSIDHWELASKYTDNTEAEKAKQLAEQALQEANKAQEAATEAQQQAEEATKELGLISSDQIITPTEKTALRQQQADIQSERNEIISSAQKYSIPYEDYNAAYDLANNALTKYTAIDPKNITIESDYSYISDYYLARQEILELIATAAKKIATDAQELAEKLQKELQDLAGRVTETESQIRVLPDQISLTVKKQISGLNYIFNTAQSLEVTGENRANQAVGKEWRIHQSISGKKYGAAFKVKFEGCTFFSNSTIVLMAGNSAGWSYQGLTGYNKVSENKEYIFFRNTNTAPETTGTGGAYIRIDYISGGKITISEVRAYDVPDSGLDEPMPWYPSKWDTEIMQTAIIQNADSISLKASQTEVDELTGRVSYAESEIKQTADSISLKVDKLQGGTNLLPHSRLTENVNGWNVNGSPNYGITTQMGESCLYLSGSTSGVGIWQNGYMPPQYKTKGNMFAVSFDIYNPNNADKLRIGLEGVFASELSVNIKDQGVSGWTRLAKTITYENIETDSFVIYTDYDNYPTVYIKHVKIEFGPYASNFTENEKDVLLATGIDIFDRKLIFTADNTLIQDNSGNKIAMFTTTPEGKPLLAATNIDVDNLKVKHLEGADGTFTGMLESGSAEKKVVINPADGSIGFYYMGKKRIDILYGQKLGLTSAISMNMYDEQGKNTSWVDQYGFHSKIAEDDQYEIVSVSDSEGVSFFKYPKTGIGRAGMIAKLGITVNEENVQLSKLFIYGDIPTSSDYLMIGQVYQENGFLKVKKQ